MARTSSGPSSPGTAAPGRPSRRARSRPGSCPTRGRARFGRGPAGRGGRRGHRRLGPDREHRHRRPGPVRPGDRYDPVPRQRAGAVGGASGRRARDRGDRDPGPPHQRRSRLRARGAAARCRPGRPVDDRLHAGYRGRRRHRHRWPGVPRAGRDRRRARSPDARTGRAAVPLREQRLPRGLRPGRPHRRGVRDGNGARGRGARAGRRSAGDRGIPPRRRASSASGSPT